MNETGKPFSVENGPKKFKNVKHPAKNLALKILSLKVAAFIKWDLGNTDIFCFKILKDYCHHCVFDL